MQRERSEAESDEDQPVVAPQHKWTMNEIDRLLGLDDPLAASPAETTQAAETTETVETDDADEAPVPPPVRPPVFAPPALTPMPEVSSSTLTAPEPEPQPQPQPEPAAEKTQVMPSFIERAPADPVPLDETVDEEPLPDEVPDETGYTRVVPTPAEAVSDAPDTEAVDVQPEEENAQAEKTRVVPTVETRSEGKTRVIGKLAAHLKGNKPQSKPRAKSDPEMVDGQMMLQGFDTEEPVQQVDEAQAERDLRARRKKQVKQFRLLEAAERYEPDLPARTDIFEPQPEPAALDADDTDDQEEYVRLSDRKRIGRLLQEERRRSFFSLCALLLLAIASVVLSAVAEKTSGDTPQILYAVNLVLLSLSVALSIPSVFAGMQDLIHWKPSCDSAAFVTIIFALIHGIVAFILPGSEHISGTFCAPAVFMLLLGKCARLFEAVGILGNFKFCAFSAAERLHTIRDFEFHADAFAIGQPLNQSHPRLRYSQPVRFATKFRTHASFRSLLDRLCRILLPASFGAALIMALTGWIVSKSALGALSAFTGSLCVALPAGAALTVSIPSVILMHNLNRRGGMIASPDAAASCADLHAVAVDAVDLFDPKHTEIYCYQDYGAIRIDDVFLYAAALAIGAHSPVEPAFLHTVGNPDILPPAHALIYEERLGISAYIRNQSVLLGNRNLLSNHSIDPPPKSAEVEYLQEGKRILYLAVDSKVCAMFVLQYAPRRSLSAPLRILQDNDTHLLAYAPDCNVSEDFLASGFGLRKGDVQLIAPAAGDLLRARQKETAENAPATVLHNGTADSLMHTLADAAVMQNIQRIAAFIAIIGCGIGWLVSFILLMIKGTATLNWIFAILYPALWIAVSLAIGIVQSRKAIQ